MLSQYNKYKDNRGNLSWGLWKRLTERGREREMGVSRSLLIKDSILNRHRCTGGPLSGHSWTHILSKLQRQASMNAYILTTCRYVLGTFWGVHWNISNNNTMLPCHFPQHLFKFRFYEIYDHKPCSLCHRLHMKLFTVFRKQWILIVVRAHKDGSSLSCLKVQEFYNCP